MQRSGEAVVKLEKICNLIQPGKIEITREKCLLYSEFRPKGGEKPAHVNAVGRIRELAGRIREITRN